MKRRRIFPLVITISACLAGCASSGDSYPSLAIRDVERAQGQFEPVASAQLDVPRVPVDASESLEVRLASLLSEAQASHQVFEANAGTARNRVAVAAGAPIASDAWASAQVALADLDSLRSNTAVPLADLDRLHVAAAVQYEEREAIEQARAQVVALVAEEDAVLAALRGALAQ